MSDAVQKRYLDLETQEIVTKEEAEVQVGEKTVTVIRRHCNGRVRDVDNWPTSRYKLIKDKKVEEPAPTPTPAPDDSGVPAT